MDLTFRVNEVVEPAEVVHLLRNSKTGRPDDDANRLVRIAPQANIVVTVRDGFKLVGLARGLKEGRGFYLSDLFVDAAYRHLDLGEQLIDRVRDVIGEQSLIVLVPSPTEIAECSCS